MTRSWWVSRINVDRGACRIVSRIKFVLSFLAHACMCARVFTRRVSFYFYFSLSLCLSFYQISRNTRKNRVGGERIVVENCLRSSLISRSSNTRVLFMSLDLLLDILNEIFSL